MTQVFKDANTDKEGGLASSIGALLVGAVAPSMIDRIVDGFVTPQSLVRLLEEKPSSQRPELKLAREGFTDLDEYTLLLGASGPIRPGIRAILRRDGITWRVVRIVFPPGEGPWETVEPRLQLGKIVPTRTAGSLVIEGDVTNSGNVASDVPPLRVALRDSAEKEVQFRIIDPPKARLSPSETARFKTTFDHPDAAATGVVVTFSPEAGVTLPDPSQPPWSSRRANHRRCRHSVRRSFSRLRLTFLRSQLSLLRRKPRRQVLPRRKQPRQRRRYLPRSRRPTRAPDTVRC